MIMLVMAEKKEEEKEEWKPTGRILEGKELEEWEHGLQDIVDSIKGLKK